LAHAIFAASRSKRGSRNASFRVFFARLPWRCLARITAWRRRRHDLRWLEHLNEHELRDLGIDRSLVENESANPFWSVQVSRKTML
jgi:uncharacterized protein YjiS (DUF1127 family)